MNRQELEVIKQKALDEKIPIIMDEALEVIKNILIKQKPKRILEIGTAVGYSAICFSEFLADEGIIDTIEIEEEKVLEARKNIERVVGVGALDDPKTITKRAVGLGLDPTAKINVIHGDAVEILRDIKRKRI